MPLSLKMAFSLFLLLIISSSLATVSVQDAALIDKICKQNQAYDLCVGALLSDGRSITADLDYLARISIDLVLVNVTDSYPVISDLLDKAQDSNMKEALGTCLDIYGKKEMNYIQVSFEALNSKNYFFLNKVAGLMGQEALGCDKVFDRLRIRQSLLGLRNKNVAYLSEITAVIASMLS